MKTQGIKSDQPHLRLVSNDEPSWQQQMPSWYQGMQTKKTVEYNDPLYLEIPPWAKAIYTTSKKNAGQRNIEFELSPRKFALIVNRANGKCELSGMPFNFDKGKFSRRPFVASLDRIDSDKGYTFHNCRLILLMVNLGMNEWGWDLFLTVAERLVEHQQQKFREDHPPIILTPIPVLDHKPEGYITAREFLAKSGFVGNAGILARRATAWCQQRQIEVVTCNIPAYQRADGSWGYTPTRAYPQEVLASVWGQ